MTGAINDARLDRKYAIPALIPDHSAFLIVAALAGAGKDIASLTQEAPNAFIFGGAMGGATMTGLGLALAQPERRVLVVTGDGDLLMSLGGLATVGVQRPNNLAILCIDNGVYGETGNQLSHTSSGVELDAVAKACGFRCVHRIELTSDIEGMPDTLARGDGPVFILLKVTDSAPPQHNRSWHASDRKAEFKRALGS